MKKQKNRLKKILQKNKEDILYLLIVGLPTGIFLIILSKFFSFGEVY